MLSIIEIVEIIEQAKREIYRSNAPYALRLLEEVGELLDRSFPQTIAWADWSLVRAEAFSAMYEDAESYFFEAFERIEKLSKEQHGVLAIKMRANEMFASFLDGKRRSSEARPYFAEAKKCAIQIPNKEAAAKNELRIIQVDLKINADPQLKNFRIMKSVVKKRADAKEEAFTHKEELAAWHLHLGETTKYGVNMKAARKVNQATEKYFLRLLESARGATE